LTLAPLERHTDRSGPRIQLDIGIHLPIPLGHRLQPDGASAQFGVAHRGERDLVGALHEYEIGMRDYGFRAVRNSLKAMRQTVTDSTLALVFSRTMLRAINALPSVKQRMARRLGEE
jgi:hypothetical protein